MLNNNNSKNINGKKDLEMNKKSKKIKIELQCTSLLLCHNTLSSIRDFKPIIDSIMFNPEHLRWIDLSHNNLETLDYDFIDFP